MGSRCHRAHPLACCPRPNRLGNWFRRHHRRSRRGARLSSAGRGRRGETGQAGETGRTGAQGDTGAQGRPGEAGLPRKQRHAIVYLFCFALLIAGGGGYLGVRGVVLAHRAISVTHHHSALCMAITQLEQNKPPPGNPVDNPSRAYEQREHAIFTQLRSGFGCPDTPEGTTP